MCDSVSWNKNLPLGVSYSHLHLNWEKNIRRNKDAEMTWEGSIMLSHALTFSFSAFTPSSKGRQAGTEMQRPWRGALLVIHSDTGQRPLPPCLLHKRMHSGGKCLWHWGFAVNTDDIQDTHQFWRKPLLLVVGAEWRALCILHKHSTTNLYF